MHKIRKYKSRDKKEKAKSHELSSSNTNTIKKADIEKTNRSYKKHNDRSVRKTRHNSER